jgi:glycosidase
MGEHLGVEGRMSVRTPMQWTDGPTAGFSSAAPSKLVRPIAEGRFGPLGVNVAAQRREPRSLLSWFERMIRRRRETPELGWGEPRVLDTDVPAVLAHRCDWEGRTVLAVHNLGAEPCVVRVDTDEAGAGARVEDMLDAGEGVIELEGDALELKLEGYAHRWYRLLPGGAPAAP